MPPRPSTCALLTRLTRSRTARLLLLRVRPSLATPSPRLPLRAQRVIARLLVCAICQLTTVGHVVIVRVGYFVGLALHELTRPTHLLPHAQVPGTARVMSSAVTSTQAAQQHMSVATTVSTRCRVLLWTRAPRSSAVPSRPSLGLLAAMLPTMWMRHAPRLAAPTSMTTRLPTLGMLLIYIFHISSVLSLSHLVCSKFLLTSAYTWYASIYNLSHFVGSFSFHISFAQSFFDFRIMNQNHVPHASPPSRFRLTLSPVLCIISGRRHIANKALSHPHRAASSMRTRTPCLR